MKYTIVTVALVIALMAMQSCQQPGYNSPGSEYMPDMGHSVAYEANHYNYYYYNTWGSEDEYYKYASPRKPVNGTVPRTSSSAGISVPEIGSVPYYYGDTEEERQRAITELIENPLPITEEGLKEGENLYNIFCATCHGEKGDGNGYLVRDDGGKYPVQPANFLLEEHLNASNGRYYHAIMHGKGLMGAYKDKMSHDERWNVIHWIRSLQAKELKLTYNQMENSLNDIDRPAGPNYLAVTAPVNTVDVEHKDDHHHMEGDAHHGHDGHGGEH